MLALLKKIFTKEKVYKHYGDKYKGDNKILNEVSKDFGFYDPEYDLNDNLT